MSRRIQRSLSRALHGRWTKRQDLDLSVPHRFIVFSDQHKGAGDQADEFRRCVATYTAALRWYLDAGFTLVLLGDVEELWENRFADVERTYREVLELEAAFPADRHCRIWGNHDDQWMERHEVKRRLRRYLPSGRVWEALRWNVHDGTRALGTVLLLHGHQGTFGSDTIAPLSRLVIRTIYRPVIQNLLGLGRETPASDACMRGRLDRELYAWAAGRSRTVLVAGHTHRPVWAARTHLQKLEAELAACLAAAGPVDEGRAGELRAATADRRAAYPPCDDTLKPLPCYFNTGCCRFDDGEITGLELVDGDLRLIKWRLAPAGTGRVVLESGGLGAILEALR